MKAFLLLLIAILAAGCGQPDSGSKGGRATIANLRAGSQSKSTPGMPGYIYFVDEGLGDVMRVRPDGTALVNLTSGQPNQKTDRKQEITEAPVASPDGRRIAYQDQDDQRIYVADADGSNPVALGNGLKGKDPAWHPSGTVLAFTGINDGNKNIYICAPDGSGLFQLTDIGGAGSSSWSPDGSMVCFMRENKGIWLVNSDGSGLKQIVDNPRATFPRWGREPE